jgi:uncharacterized membrane protein
VTSQPAEISGPQRRFAFIDLLKGVAIVAMVIYHAGFIFSQEQLIGTDVANDPVWTVFARLIATAFVALVGFNVVLATRNGLRPGRYLRRVAIIAAAAALVTAGTYFFFDPTTYIFFGILHQIALSSLLLLAFLMAPNALIAATSAAVIALPFFYAHPFFDAPLLWWVGLPTIPPTTLDYVPLFPWFGVALGGMLAGRMFVANGLGSRLAMWNPDGAVARAVHVASRWSLAIYLIHPVILSGIALLLVNVFPPNIDIARTRWNAQCVPSCQTENGSETICTAFCTCMFEGLFDTDLYEIKTVDAMSDEQRGRWTSIIEQCGASIPRPLE